MERGWRVDKGLVIEEQGGEGDLPCVWSTRESAGYRNKCFQRLDVVEFDRQASCGR